MSRGGKILITGAAGQLGVELTRHLRARHGTVRVLATDVRESGLVSGTAPFEQLDVLDRDGLTRIVKRHRIGTIYHLAAILSARGEADIRRSWELNMDGLLNVLELARDEGVATSNRIRIFWPSSIAVFGPDLPRENTPQDCPLNPCTVYGITKLAGEQLCAYYHRKFGVDVRSLRFPGLIGNRSEPGGGTTDYSVEMLRAAAAGTSFVCPVGSDTRLPMMYMDDAVRAVTTLMDADVSRVRLRSGYNVTAMSFSPDELRNAIRVYVNGFDVTYRPDHRAEIAASWPDSIDDFAARRDWGWKPEFDLDAMVREVLGIG